MSVTGVKPSISSTAVLGTATTPATNPTLPNNQKWGYTPGPLFGAQGPVSSDIQEGSTGDCYFLADLQSLADHDPTFLQNHIKEVANPADPAHPNYDVTLYDSQGQAQEVYVDGQQLENSDGTPKSLGTVSSPTWSAIYEKAAVIASGGSYSDFAGGNPANAWALLTGQAGSDQPLPESSDDFAAAVQKAGTGTAFVSQASEKTLAALPKNSDGSYSIANGAYSLTMGGKNGGMYQITDKASGQQWSIPNSHVMPVASVQQGPNGLTANLENPDEDNANNPTGAHIDGVPYAVLQAIGGSYASLPLPSSSPASSVTLSQVGSVGFLPEGTKRSE